MIHKMFEHCVLKNADKEAISFDGKVMSYSQLNNLVNQIACSLQKEGITEGDIVGICINRSFEMIASIIAILKVGAAYLPLDADYPKARLSFMINHSRAKIILCDSEVESILEDHKSILLNIKNCDLKSQTLIRQIDDSKVDLAYVIYTSGSTGIPKGVALSHKALENLIQWQNKQSSKVINNTTLQFTPVSFDVHFQEIFSTLTTGGKLILISEETRLDSLNLLKTIKEEKITRLFLPFVALNHLSQMACEYEIYPESLCEVTTAGEQLRITKDLRGLFSKLKDAILYNHYGPSETHVITSYSLEGNPEKWEDLPPIGQAIDNTSVFILDENMNEVALGEEGQLYLSGVCLANGYIHEDELTAQRFINHKNLGLLYQSGDLGFINKENQIIYTGRIDGQVKVRGYRIELGEVETALEKISGVKQAAVTSFSDNGEKYLCAFVVGSMDMSIIRSELKDKIPEYMIPSFFEKLVKLPLTPSGKVDKKNLIEPKRVRPELVNEFIEACSKSENLIKQLWAKHLKIESIGITDSFFDLGGNSLMALKILAELKHKYNRDISIVKLFQYPTIKDIAAFLDGNSNKLEKLEEKLSKKIKSSNQDIAIIGMAGKFPGANNVEEFWDNILDGKNSVEIFDKSKTSTSSIELAQNADFVRATGILPDYDKFDCQYFGITPREAELMDPQQRKFLEITVEAMENAGQSVQKFDGSIGVFAGMANNTYQFLINEYPEKIANLGAFNVMLANEKDYIATRVAHKLNLTGPALSIHTGCSTSLVSIITAVKSLRDMDCDMAIAGGISVKADPYQGHLFQDGGILSRDGVCRPFDKNATGTIFTDGGGAVILKRLSDAEADGDNILAVVKGVALNNDGGDKMSFTAPSVDGQAEVIVKALLDGGIDPATIGYIEAHGTATPVGDPIEFEGLKTAFGLKTDKKEFCYLGSVKSNIGHLTSAAGVAGVIKAVKSVQASVIAKTANFSALNPSIELNDTPFLIATENISFPQNHENNRAAISSFGVGGTNAHLIVEEYKGKESETSNKSIQLLKISAKKEKALEQLESELLAYMNSSSLKVQRQCAFTLDKGRDEHAFRKSIVVYTENNKNVEILTSNSKKVSSQNDLVFMFPGQGSQYIEMGKSLLEYNEIFKNSFDKCCDILKEIQDKDLRDIIFKKSMTDEEAKDALKNTYYTQPALFTIEYSLATMLLSFGLEPKKLIGHSVGEFVAATIAGVFSLEDGLRMIAKRAELMQSLPEGDMLSVALSSQEVSKYLNENIQVASENAPNLCVVAGASEEISKLVKKLGEDNITCRLLQTSHAFHSNMMKPVEKEFEEFVSKIEMRVPSLDIISTVTGDLESDLFTRPSYWANHMVATVKFASAIDKCLSSGSKTLLEVGPRRTLATLSQKVVLKNKDKNSKTMSLLGDLPSEEVKNLLTAIGQLWICGHSVNRGNFYSKEEMILAQIPTYPFEKKKIWLEKKNTILKQEIIKGETMKNSIQDDLIKQLAVIFDDASGVDVLEFDNNTTFLEMGMDSLLLTQVALSLKKAFKTEITFRQLLENQASLNDLSSFILDNASSDLLPKQAAPTPQAASTPVQEVKQAPVAIEQAPVQLTQMAPVATGSGLEGIINRQLELLGQQLQLLSGVSITQSTSSVPVVSAPVAQMHTSEVTAKEVVAKSTQPVKKKAEVNNAKKAFGACARISTEEDTSLTAQQKSFISDFIAKYNSKTKSSKTFTQDNRKTHADPRAVTGFRPEIKEITYPVVVKKSKGQYLWDLDENMYVDMTCGFGSNFFGNGNERILKYVNQQLLDGIEIGPQHPLTADVSKLVCELTGNERAAFCNTGSEAVLGAMRVARTVTGRDKIIAFSGSYHGINDEVIIRASKSGKSFPAAPGINKSSVEDMIILEYGTEESLKVIREMASEVAAVLVEPVQSRRADFHPKEFLQEIRKITLESETCLIFDEVITGFRIHPGGAQAYFDVRADLCTYGKIVGGGMPIGIVSGKAEYMDALDGGSWQYGDASIPTVGVTYFAGTFVRHPLALAAAKGALEIIKEGGVKQLSDLNMKAQKFVDEINLFNSQVNAPIKLVNFGSLMKPKWTQDVPEGDLFFAALRLNGVHAYDGFPWFANLAHTDEDLAFVVDAWKKAMALMQINGLVPGLSDNSLSKEIFSGSNPPAQNARLGRDENGNPAWYVEQPAKSGNYFKLEI